MTPEQQALYDRIVAFSLDEPDALFPFSHKLAKENGWTLAYSERAIAEYKRFAFLAMLSPQPVSPSEQVDQVWHMHMTYTQSYWDEFCGQVLGQPFHHYPSKGGANEQDKYRKLYEDTLTLYEATFGEKPPADIWSDPDTRFGADLAVERVNTNRYYVIEKAGMMRGALDIALVIALPAALILAVTLVSGNSPLDWLGPDFLGLYFTLLIVGSAAAFYLRFFYTPARPTPTHQSDLTELDLAYLSGGSERVADTALITLMELGAVERLPNNRFAAAGALSGRALPVERAVHDTAHAEGGTTVEQIRRVVRRPAEAMRERLERAGLIPDEAERWVRAALPRIILIGLLLLGLLKTAVGIARDRPVSYLIVLCLVTAILILIVFGGELMRTRQADKLIRQAQKAKSGRSTTIGTDTQSIHWHTPLSLGVALYGAAALVNTPYHDLQRVLQPASGGGDGGGGDGGGCGGGCGGCGGCGG